MVEVAGKSEPLRIPVWKYLLFLFLMFILLLVLLYFLLASNFGANNSFFETLRRYFSFVSAFHPNLKPEDNFDKALRIHGFEKIGPKRFQLFVSATGSDAAPVKVLQPSEVSLKVKDGQKKDLTVMIDRVRPLHMYSEWPDPVSFSIVMDYSGSMFPQDVEAIEKYYANLIGELALPFSAAVFKFNDKVKEMLDLSSDKNAVLDAIKKPLTLLNTALYDGIDKGIEKLQARPHLRFIVLTTDGNDNASIANFEDVVRRSRQHNVSVFSFGFGWLDVSKLKELSDRTEGYYSYVPDSSRLGDWFKKLGQIINNIQVIEFSTDVDMNHPAELDLTVDYNNQKLNRVRTWP